MKISYAILTHNEGEYVGELLTFLTTYKRDIDEIVVVDEAKKSNFGADHVFDSQSFNSAFADWKFENRLSSLKTFSTLVQDHLNRAKLI